MTEAPPRMRYGRSGDDASARAMAAEDGGHESESDFALESDEDRHFNQIEEWIILADRRLERLDARIERLTVAVDQMNAQLSAVLTEMPTRRGVNLYLVGGLVGGLAVGLAIMGITIGGFVGGLSSLKPNAASQVSAPPVAYPQQPQAPIIIQMPSNALSGALPGALSQPVAIPLSPSSSSK